MDRTILLVDDETSLRKSLAYLFHQYGFRVVEAGDGEEALLLAELERPDLIIMDLAMPIRDGLSAARELRRSAELKEIPILAHSGTPMGSSDLDEVLTLFDGFLQKPAAVRPLLGMVHKLLHDPRPRYHRAELNGRGSLPERRDAGVA